MWIILLLSLVLAPGVAVAATCGSVTSNITATDRSSATIAYTTPAGSNQTLFVGVGDRHGSSNTVTGITHAGNAMTQKIQRKDAVPVMGASLYYIKNPTSGTNNVIVTWGTTMLATGVVIFTCADTHSDADPFRNAGASAEGLSTAPSVTVTDSSGDITIDVMAVDSNSSAPTQGANQTTLFAGSPGAELGLGVSTQDGGLGGVMSWTVSSNEWSIVAAPLLGSGFNSARRRYQE